MVQAFTKTGILRSLSQNIRQSFGVNLLVVALVMLAGIGTASTLPVFVAMMFGATLGGNATLIGASANGVSAGICATYGKPLSFATSLRYGVPLTLCQLAVSALYVVVLFYVIGR